MSRDSFLNYREYIPKLIANEGFVALYRGFWATFWRDVPSWGIYFYVFEKCKQEFAHYSQTKEPTIFQKMMAGGTAGVACWVSNYPFDIVKSHIQCSKGNQTITMKEAFLHYYRLYGYKYFFRGLLPTVLRAFPTNAITLSVFDAINSHLL